MHSNFYTPFLYGIIGMWPLTISSMIESPFFQSHKIHTNATPLGTFASVKGPPTNVHFVCKTLALLPFWDIRIFFGD
jgi:hypothetical protein